MFGIPDANANELQKLQQNELRCSLSQILRELALSQDTLMYYDNRAAYAVVTDDVINEIKYHVFESSRALERLRCMLKRVDATNHPSSQPISPIQRQQDSLTNGTRYHCSGFAQLKANSSDSLYSIRSLNGASRSSSLDIGSAIREGAALDNGPTGTQKVTSSTTVDEADTLGNVIPTPFRQPGAHASDERRRELNADTPQSDQTASGNHSYDRSVSQMSHAGPSNQLPSEPPSKDPFPSKPPSTDAFPKKPLQTFNEFCTAQYLNGHQKSDRFRKANGNHRTREGMNASRPKSGQRSSYGAHRRTDTVNSFTEMRKPSDVAQSDSLTTNPSKSNTSEESFRQPSRIVGDEERKLDDLANALEQSLTMNDGYSDVDLDNSFQLGETSVPEKVLMTCSSGYIPNDIALQRMPPFAQFVRAVVSHAEADFLYLQLLSDDQLLQTLGEKLDKNLVPTLKYSTVRPGDYVSCLFDEDQHFYRAQLVRATRDDQFEVNFIDYGNTSAVSVDRMRKMKKICHNTPRLALKCRFASRLKEERYKNEMIELSVSGSFMVSFSQVYETNIENREVFIIEDVAFDPAV